MLREVELKVLEVNVREMHERLMRLGARKVEHGLVHEVAFDFPNGRIRKKDELFRIRQYGKRTEIAYKTNSAHHKDFLEHDEYETVVGDFDIICKIMKLLGLKMIRDREKKRTSYALGKVKIEIDKYPAIPPYLEIEGRKKDIKDALKKMGYSMKDTTNMTSTKVLKYYKQDPDYQRFRK